MHTAQLKQNTFIRNNFFITREDTDILQRHHLLIYPLGCKVFLGTPALLLLSKCIIKVTLCRCSVTGTVEAHC